MSSIEYNFSPIGVVESCFKQKFGIPRQPGLAPSTQAKIWIYPPFNNPDAFDGLSESSHLWIQFVFHKTPQSKPWRPKVRPPRLGGNKSLGVFATRSPNRPNPIGLSVVKNEGLEVDGDKLCVCISGIDLLEGTPVLDIKPYIPYADIIPSATNTMAHSAPKLLPVSFSGRARQFCQNYQLDTGTDLISLIDETLGQDPRPQYQSNIDGRVYAMLLLKLDVQWTYFTGEGGTELMVEQIIAVS